MQLVSLFFAPCFLRCRQAHDARHHGRNDQRDSIAATHGRNLVDLAMACARLILLVFYTSRCVSSLFGRPVMLGIMAGFNQDDIFALFVDPCRHAEVFSHGPDCSSDHRDSPVREQGDRCPCYAVRASSTGCHLPCCDAEADPHGLVDHGDSAFAGGHGDRCPCCAGGARSTGAVVERQLCFHSLHLLRNSLRAAHELRCFFFRALYTGTGRRSFPQGHGPHN